MNSTIDLIEFTKIVWQEVFKKVNKAVVFVDDAFAECLHWMGGATTLIVSGAVDIKQFSSFENAKHNQRKAVFLVSSPIYGTSEQILADILRASNFEYVILISSLPPALHTLIRYGQVDEEKKAFHHIEDIMLECMGNKNFTADVLYLPLTCAPVTSHMFVLPGHHDVTPLLPNQWQQLLAQSEVKTPNPSAGDLDSSQLPNEFQRKVKLLAYSLNGVLEVLDVSDDVYSLGDTSRLVATELANLTVAKHRRKTSQKKASVVLVDRTLDLVNVLGHHGDTLLDKILAVNHPLPGHHNDVSVNMAPLCDVKNSCSDVILPGCLAHNTSHVARELFFVMATAKHKEALLEVKLSLEEAITKEDLPVTPDRDQSTATQIHTYLNAFQGKGAKLRRQSAVLQLASATAHSLKQLSVCNHDSLLGVEKGLLQSLGEEGPAAMPQMMQLLEKYVQLSENDRTYSLTDILGLMAYVYSLQNSDDMIDRGEEQQIKSLLVKALLATSAEQLPPCLAHSLQGREVADMARELASRVMYTLRGLANTRMSLKKFRHVFKEGDEMSQAQLTPLLQQLTAEIFQPSKQEVPDLEYKSTGFRDLLKSGFGLFMNVSKPRPNDHALLLVFVVGGVSSSELRLIQNTADAASTHTQVVVGSTRLVTPNDVIGQIFSSEVTSSLQTL